MRACGQARLMGPLMVALLVLGGCGGGRGTEAAREEPASEDTQPMPQSYTPAQEPEREEKATLCDVIPHEDVSSAFGGKLVVASIGAADEVNCLYDLSLGTGERLEGGQLIVHKVQAALYEGEKESYEGKDIYEPLAGVGREAYVLNQAQVNALVDDDTAIRLGLMLVVGGELPLTKEECRAGVVELAGKLVERV